MAKSKILSDAEGLAERARERMAELQTSMEPLNLGPFNRYLDWPTFVLAVIGAIVAICSVGFLVLPGAIVGMGSLIAFSLKFWGIT